MAEEITHQFPKDGFNLILARLDSIDAQFVSLNSRMAALEEKVDKRLMDTRPIWEQVLVRLDAIESRLDSIESRLDAIEVRLSSIESRLDRVEDELHDQSRKFRVFLKDVVRLQDAQEDLDERVQKLESTPTA
jgi:chromosome segregation ATPase